jgi:hypothetical protein
LIKNFVEDKYSNCLKFNSKGKITVFYGSFPRAIWNGGRTLSFNSVPINKGTVEHTVNFLNDRGIKLRMTFTNSLLEEKHLSDEYCNMILKILDNGFGNGIITASPLLDKYLKENYPNLPRISSITKGGDFETFKEAFYQDYEMIVIYPRNNILEFLQKETTLQERQRIEVMLSSGCGYCPFTKEHYYVESYNNLYQKTEKSFTCYRRENIEIN